MSDAVQARDRAVIEAVHALEPAARLQWRALVELESPSSDTSALDRALTWIEGALAGLGASIERMPASGKQGGIGAPDGSAHGAGVTVARRGADDHRRMLLCVHLDTVHAPHVRQRRPMMWTRRM